MGRPPQQRPDTTKTDDRPEEDVWGTVPKVHDTPLHSVQGGASNDVHNKVEDVGHANPKDEHRKDEEEELAREELQTILKKSPIVIFSKSYCPYSKRAKALLLDTYTITPTPHVVELDLMNQKLPRPPHQNIGDDDDEDDDRPVSTLGRKLQDLLASLTGRHTVPNIMINSQSLGGGDDVARMHADGTLEEEIKKLGGKRIVSIERKHGVET
jgi:glutaredoxin